METNSVLCLTDNTTVCTTVSSPELLITVVQLCNSSCTRPSKQYSTALSRGYISEFPPSPLLLTVFRPKLNAEAYNILSHRHVHQPIYPDSFRRSNRCKINYGNDLDPKGVTCLLLKSMVKRPAMLRPLNFFLIF